MTYQSSLDEIDVDWRHQVKLGIEYERKRDFPNALQCLDTAVQYGAEQTSEFLYYRALTHRGLGNLRAAMEDLKRCIQMDPKSPSSYIEAPSIMDQMGQLSKAQWLLKTAIKLSPASQRPILEANLSQLHIKAAALNTRVDPVMVLPEELVRQIFRIRVEEDPDAAIPLSHVSQTWRKLTINSPEIWSKLRVGGLKSVAKAEAWIDRTGGHINELDLQTNLQSTLHKLVQALIPSTPYLKQVKIDLTAQAELDCLLEGWEMRLEKVEILKITVTARRTNFSRMGNRWDGLLLSPTSTSLKALVINGIHDDGYPTVQTSKPFEDEQLRNLSILEIHGRVTVDTIQSKTDPDKHLWPSDYKDTPSGTLHAILAKAPNLVRLIIGDVATVQIPKPLEERLDPVAARISLPKLQQVIFRGQSPDNLLVHLKDLEEVHTLVFMHSINEGILRDTLETSGIKLKKLTDFSYLHAAHEEDLTDLLKEMKALKILRLGDLNGTDEVELLATDLTVCPKLELLHLMSAHVTSSPIMNLVKSRMAKKVVEKFEDTRKGEHELVKGESSRSIFRPLIRKRRSSEMSIDEDSKKQKIEEVGMEMDIVEDPEPHSKEEDSLPPPPPSPINTLILIRCPHIEKPAEVWLKSHVKHFTMIYPPPPPVRGGHHHNHH